MYSGGYRGRILRVNLSDKICKIECIESGLYSRFLGGRGLAAKFYFDEVASAVKPFDEENKIFLFTGPLTGVSLPSTTKFQLATKSPETRIYQCSNCGGEFGPQLKRCGFDGLILEGKADVWSVLYIEDEQVRFEDASDLVGLDSAETLKRIKAAMGEPRAAGMSVGPAAERLVRLSYINVDSRAFGRGGPGAVLGSKKLKGIGIRGGGQIPVADAESVKEIRRKATQELKSSRANHTKYGTPQYIEVINELGCMPTRNFQTAYFEDGSKIDAHEMYDNYLERNYACFHCPVACGKICSVKEGPYAGARARTEYETVALMGPNCGVADFGAIVKANQMCDELGMDTMSAANAVALTMELFERGLIGKDETNGIEARFGSGDALIGIIELIAARKGIGELLAEGMLHVRKVKPEWSPYILDVKGMPFAAYDPRGFHGNALTYGTSSRGACHNVGGWTIRAELQSGKYDRYATEGKGELVKSIQDNRAYVDSLGICTVVRSSMGFTDQPYGKVLEAITGYDFTPKLLEIGERIYNLERLILNREGVSRKDDQMPERILKEKIPSGPTAGRIVTNDMYASMLDEYYQVRGWDNDGAPTEQKKRELGLTELTN
jgi:aldehyde:ferredoxin oxidoreductase